MVKKATHKRTRVEYAVKIINVTSQPLGDDAMTLEEIAEEVRLTMSFSNVVNANVVKVFDFYVSPGNVYVVMELLTGGSLLDALTTEGCFSERKAAAVLHKLFTGLELIHGDAMAHRDLKLKNLVFASKSFEKNPVNPRHQKKVVDLETLRIADFGLARKFSCARARLTARCGTPQYVAPEIVNGEPYTPAVDMWYVLRVSQIQPPCFCRPSLTSTAVVERRYYPHQKCTVRPDYHDCLLAHITKYTHTRRLRTDTLFCPSQGVRCYSVRHCFRRAPFRSPRPSLQLQVNKSGSVPRAVETRVPRARRFVTQTAGG